MPHEDACRTLAMHFLSDYRLSVEEQEAEAVRLVRAIQDVMEAELENLAHRRIAR